MFPTVRTVKDTVIIHGLLRLFISFCSLLFTYLHTSSQEKLLQFSITGMKMRESSLFILSQDIRLVIGFQCLHSFKNKFRKDFSLCVYLEQSSMENCGLVQACPLTKRSHGISLTRGFIPLPLTFWYFF